MQVSTGKNNLHHGFKTYFIISLIYKNMFCGNSEYWMTVFNNSSNKLLSRTFTQLSLPHPCTLVSFVFTLLYWKVRKITPVITGHKPCKESCWLSFQKKVRSSQSWIFPSYKLKELCVKPVSVLTCLPQLVHDCISAASVNKQNSIHQEKLVLKSYSNSRIHLNFCSACLTYTKSWDLSSIPH